MLSRNDLKDYQNVAIKYLVDKPNSGLILGMGLGKTVIVATMLSDLMKAGEIKDKVLIIAPKRVAHTTWPSEFHKWEHLRDIDYQNIEGSALERLIALRSKAPIHIIAYEFVTWLCKALKGRWPYRTLIIDESSFIKSYTAKRFLALKSVVDFGNRKLVDRVHILTATPAVESYEHYWSQMYMLDNGVSLGKYITHFRRAFMELKPYSFKYTPRGDSAIKKILNRVARKCLVMKTRDYIDLDEPLYQDIYFDLSKESRKLYNGFFSKHFMPIENAKGGKVVAETGVAVQQKLLQLASGSIYERIVHEDEKVEIVIHKLHSEKIDYVTELVEALGGEPLVIAYHWKSSKADLIKALPKAKLMDDKGEITEQWNKRQIPVMLIHPQGVSHGLNMQYGGYNILFYDIPWSYERYDQTIGRLCRLGQENKVNVMHMVCRGTMDEIVRKAVGNKMDAHEFMLNVIKEYNEVFS